MNPLYFLFILIIFIPCIPCMIPCMPCILPCISSMLSSSIAYNTSQTKPKTKTETFINQSNMSCPVCGDKI